MWRDRGRQIWVLVKPVLPSSPLLSPSLQCALPDLSGDGVTDGPPGSGPGQLSSSELQPPGHPSNRPLQGLSPGHYTDRQPKEVSMCAEPPGTPETRFWLLFTFPMILLEGSSFAAITQ